MKMYYLYNKKVAYITPYGAYLLNTMYINTEYDLWPSNVSDIATVFIVELIRIY